MYIYICIGVLVSLAPRLTQPFILLGLIKLVQGTDKELTALRQLNPVHRNYKVVFFLSNYTRFTEFFFLLYKGGWGANYAIHVLPG